MNGITLNEMLALDVALLYARLNSYPFLSYISAQSMSTVSTTGLDGRQLVRGKVQFQVWICSAGVETDLEPRPPPLAPSQVITSCQHFFPICIC